MSIRLPLRRSDPEAARKASGVVDFAKSGRYSLTVQSFAVARMRSAAALLLRCLAVGALCAILCAIGLSGIDAARAQNDKGGPLRFLKPWIEERLFGQKPPEAPPAPESPAASAPPTPGAESNDAAAGVGAAEIPPPATSPEAPATGESSGESGMALRGASTEEPAEPPGVPTVATPEPLRFALLAGRSVVATMAAVGPVADALSEALGRPVELLPLPSYDSMIDAQSERRIDGGFFSAAAYALADNRCNCIEPLLTPHASDGTAAYYAVIVVRADSGIATLADLKGKTLAVGAADSIGLRRAQLAGILAEGFDPATTFGSVLAVEADQNALSLVASGAADAAFGWSSLAGDVASGYTRGSFTDLVASGAVAMDRLAILWRSPPIGHAPFAVLRTLSEADKTKIGAYLTGLGDNNPAAYDALEPFYGGGYAAADPKDYGGFETLMATNIDAVRLPLAPAATGATSATQASPAADGSEAASSPSP